MLVTETYCADLGGIQPRPPPVILKGAFTDKEAWDFSKSVFKNYKPDKKGLIDQCFDIDWENTKCEKIIRGDGESDKVKAYIKGIYGHMRETYKYYAGLSPLGRMPCIGPGTLTELLNRCDGFIDGKTIKISDVDLQVIACNGGKRVVNYLSPDKALIRAQFIEVLVRLALDKYFKTKEAATHSEAVEMAFEKHFLPYFKTFECHNWRMERLWQEEIDILYTRFHDKLQFIYKKYTGKYATPGSNKFTMSLEEFTTLLGHGGLLNENFGNREAGPLWNLAMMTNKDEFTSEKHINMQFVEFLEALARVADKFNMDNMEDFFPEYKAKSPYGLDKKLETTCLMICNAALPEKQFKALYKTYKAKVDQEVENAKLGIVTQFAKK